MPSQDGERKRFFRMRSAALCAALALALGFAPGRRRRPIRVHDLGSRYAGLHRRRKGRIFCQPRYFGQCVRYGQIAERPRGRDLGAAQVRDSVIASKADHSERGGNQCLPLPGHPATFAKSPAALGGKGGRSGGGLRWLTGARQTQNPCRQGAEASNPAA
jgi:hypothetical protein